MICLFVCLYVARNTYIIFYFSKQCNKPAGKSSKSEPVCRKHEMLRKITGIYQDLEKKDGGKSFEKRRMLLKHEMPLKQQLFEEFRGKSFR